MAFRVVAVTLELVTSLYPFLGFLVVIAIIALVVIAHKLALRHSDSAKAGTQNRIRFVYVVGLLAEAGVVGYFAIEDTSIKTQAGEPTEYRITKGPIGCPFQVQGGLYLGVISSWEPYSWAICQRRGLSFVQIELIEQLTGHVSIRSNAQALSFVRLFSTVAYDNYMPHDMFEVMEKPAVGAILGEPGSSFFVSIGSHDDGTEGVVPRGWMVAHHIPTPTVTQSKDGWIVHRTCIVTRDARSFETVAVTEFVGPHGEYSRTEQRTNIQPPKTGWKYACCDE